MTARSPIGSFRRQIVWLTVAVTAIGVVGMALLVQLILTRTAVADVDTVLRSRIDGVIHATSGASSTSGLVVPQAELEAGVAVFDDRGDLVAGSIPPALADQYSELSSATSMTTFNVREQEQLRAEPFTTPDGVDGVVVVTEHLAPYEQAERVALLASIVAGAVMVAVAAGLAAVVSRRALAPVAAMARTAEQWSEHDLSQRFDLGPPRNEITALGRTLDGLLDKVSAAIRSEQRLTLELAHELRTPLAAAHGAADLALLRADLDADLREDLVQIQVATRRMSDTIAGLLDLARSGASNTEASSSDLTAVVEEVVTTVDVAGAEVSVDLPGPMRLALPQALAVRALAPVVENAARVGRHVHIGVGQHGSGFVTVQVDDDGPGVEPENRERIFEPGETADASVGAGLGLALARRIARSAGGDVAVDPSGAQTRFAIRLPLV